MPDDVADDAQLSVLQVLCASPACLAALQTVLSAGLPGWAEPVLEAVTRRCDDGSVNLQLLAVVLLRLEHLGCGGDGGDSSSSNGGIGDPGLSSSNPGCSTSSMAAWRAGAPKVAGGNLRLPPEVAVAIQVTLRQLAGALPSLPQLRRAPGGGETTAYAAPAEAQGSWKALRALCWCDDENALRVARVWLQRLLALTLQLSLRVRRARRSGGGRGAVLAAVQFCACAAGLRACAALHN